MILRGQNAHFPSPEKSLNGCSFVVPGNITICLYFLPVLNVFLCFCSSGVCNVL